jgi:hypothetical protein
MSIRDCVEKLVAVGRVTRAIADEALGLYDRARGAYSETMGPASADAAAALAVAKEMAAGAKRLKNQADKQALGWASLERRILEHEKGAAAGMMAVLTRDIWEKGGQNVHTLSEVIWSQLSRHFEAGLKAYQPGILGQSRDQLYSVRNMIREAFGADTGDQTAKAAAAGWKTATDEAVDRARAAGRIFDPNETWRVPQFWESSRVRKFDRGEFRQDFLDEVNRGALTLYDKDTGMPAAASRFDAVLARAYYDITTSGGTTGAFSPEMRTFQFSAGEPGAEAWLRLSAKYGVGDNVIGLLTGHLNRMAREIALMEMMGPNHAATFRAGMRYLNEQEATLKLRQRLNPLRMLESRSMAERTYKVLTGEANAIEGPLLSGFFGALRSISTAAQLKGAIISSVPSDSVTTALASAHVGMEPTRVLGAAVREIARGGDESMALASRLNLVAHSAMDYGHGYRFFQDQIGGPESFKFVATAMIRAQGLQAWTELIKRTFTMEFTGHLADHARHGLDELAAVNAPLRQFLDRHGITAAEWDTIRKTVPLTVDGATFLDTAAIKDRALQEKLLGAIIEERNFAMLEPDARIRAITTGGLPNGTFMGELSRSLFLFKSFSMTMAATHMMRLATQGPIEKRIWNATLFALFSSIAGASAMQAKNLVYGKTPEDMDNATFWAKAFLQGGGIGIYGDLLNSSFSRSGRSPLADLAGPIGGMAEDAARLSSGQVRKLYEGGDTTLGAEAVKTLRRYTPGTFFTKLAVDRLIFDQLQMLVDPDYRASFRRAERRLQQDTGQSWWWKPGEVAPVQQ